jgi:transformation/transcription domain-associated protein
MQTLPSYSRLIENLLVSNVRYLQSTSPQFISESIIFQIRKKIFEIFQRANPFHNVILLSDIHSNILYDNRVQLCKDILQLMYNMILVENEENVIICLKIIIDYHRYLKTINLNNQVIFVIHFLLFEYRVY